MGLAIVAIPEEQDRVWKVSSEKVPHLTLLFLGEPENADLQQIMQFVQHAVTLSEHGPFYLDVDRRGVLGDAEADVLFFSKRSWNLRWIKQFRGQLLQNGAIRSAYDSAEQFTAPQDWVPHLTLGYPNAPAKKLEGDNDYPLYSVAFDRIAVWAGNFEGPEFRLEWPERPEEFDGPLAVAWADQQKAALKHYGIKGMRWGQRKTETVTVGGKTKRVTPKKAAKLDKKWEENQYKLPKAIERHNKTGEYFNSRIGAVNDKFKDDFSKEAHDNPALWSPRYKEYNREVNGLLAEGSRRAVESESPSPTGKKRTAIEFSADGESMRVVIRDADKVKHADGENEAEVFLFGITRNEKGLIAKAEPLETEESMSQSTELGQSVIELGEEFLEHYGVKGMKWGVTRRKAHGKKAQRLNKKADALEGAASRTKRDTLRRRSLNARATRARRQADLAQRISEGKGPGKAAAKKVASGAKATGRGLKKAANALDEYFYETSAYSSTAHVAIHNKVADRVDSKIYQLQASPKYRGKNLKADKDLETQYHQDVAKVTDAAYQRAVRDVIGENRRGTKEARYVNDVRGARIEIRDKKTGNKLREADITPDQAINTNQLDGAGPQSPARERARHAATDTPVDLPDITIPLKLDSNGQIKAVGRVKTEATHGEVFVDALIHGADSTMELGEQFILEHYGIKGMRWGFRKRPEAVAPTATSRVPNGKKRKTKIEVEGGENHEAAPDAIKVAQHKAKLKKSGPAALTNQELREVAERVRLEEQAKLLTGNKAKQFVTRELQNEGRQVAKGAAKKGAKKAGTKAAAALL